MSISVQTNSAKIALRTSGARPNVHIGPQNVICHLSQGFNPGNPDGVQGYAFEAEGEVGVNKGRNDSWAGWDFGFVQIARAKDISFYYAGKRPSDGSITIHAHLPPALPYSLVLDTELEISPWTRKPPRYKHSSPNVSCLTGDHPAVRAGRELANRKTNQANYLYHIVNECEFWTIFSYHDPVSKPHCLAHFSWRLRYDIKFSWSGGEPRRGNSKPLLSFGPVVKGLPADPGVRQLIENPVTYKSFNVMVRQAISYALLSGPRENREDHPERYANVPGNFYT
jgi:hypothetical protein